MDKDFEIKFKIIKKLVLLVGEQSKRLADKSLKLSDTLNLYHNLAVDYNILTMHYFKKSDIDIDIFQKIKVTLLKINPDYGFYLEKI